MMQFEQEHQGSERDPSKIENQETLRSKKILDSANKSS